MKMWIVLDVTFVNEMDQLQTPKHRFFQVAFIIVSFTALKSMKHVKRMLSSIFVSCYLYYFVAVLFLLIPTYITMAQKCHYSRSVKLRIRICYKLSYLFQISKPAFEIRGSSTSEHVNISSNDQTLMTNSTTYVVYILPPNWSTEQMSQDYIHSSLFNNVPACCTVHMFGSGVRKISRTKDSDSDRLRRIIK